MLRFRHLAPLAIFALAYAAIAFTITNSYYQLMMTLVLVWASFGLAWNMFSGYTGLISFGHAVFFGLGAYLTALGQVYFDLTPWFLIPCAAIVGGVAGFLIGAITFRLRSHYFALAMLAYPLAILNIFMWLGYQEVTIPMKHKDAVLYMQFTDGRIYTFIAIIFTIAIVILSLAVERSRFGMALIAIKQNEAAAEAAGINTLAWKLRAITLSGAVTAAIGAFYVMVLLVVTPESVFGMLVSAQALTVTMFGGIGTIWGPLIGATILIPTGQILQAKLGAQFPGIEGVIYGLAIVVVILAAPEGIFWRVRDALKNRGKKAAALPELQSASITPPARFPIEAPARATDGDVILTVRNLSKSFGGLKAAQNINFDVRRGEILGIIGPNGAGKTTLFNLLNGFQRADSGEVVLDGKNVAGVKPHQLCAAGVGRTFQIMRPFPRLSVTDNVIIGAYVRSKNDDEARTRANDAIARVGLSSAAQRIASELTTKELRLMELARALAGGPHLLLLDETLAGLGSQEAADVVAVLRDLAARGLTIVIIEHTMHAMVRLVDRFLVLDHGAVLAEGAPHVITKDSRVVEAYLGTKWSANA